ncbi:LysM peptidoglycan-binding domain-containing protein [Thalassospira mesophila]|uniref:Peptidoglycan-binding protein n=1 Tax=Thalassospira mesophila TaxID=1293891 RepID=A0A1Y2L377_9PROT|nr:Ig-like domain-containing protein [Thalassospira mesophila]OSQ39926.1 peptidoglycan-binding protein [Thalassospira mesophila]
MKRPYILVIIGVLLIIAAIVLNYTLTGSGDDDADAVSTSPAPAGAGGAASTANSAPDSGDKAVTSDDSNAPDVTDPSFDVVRVSPDGNSVIAGRAEPNTKVRVREGKDVIGEATADNQGEWVILPEKPLEPGDRELSVESEDKDGKVQSSNENVVVLIPENPASETTAPMVTQKSDTAAPDEKSKSDQQPIIALRVPSQGNGPATVLQGPGAVPENKEMAQAANQAAQAAGQPEIASSMPRLSVGVVDYDDKGQVAMSGAADPDHNIRVYLDNKFVGTAPSDDKGGWSMTLGADIDPGQYKLRADELDKQGKVIARVELPFERADAKKAMEPGKRYIVQPGNSLWRIARRAYGDGIQYWVIYHRNEDQIRDPDLIYPGQIFALPESDATK